MSLCYYNNKGTQERVPTTHTLLHMHVYTHIHTHAGKGTQTTHVCIDTTKTHKHVIYSLRLHCTTVLLPEDNIVDMPAADIYKMITGMIITL